MTSIEPIIEMDARFSSPGAAPLPWADVVHVIDQAEIFWLSTVRSDGRPHVTPLPVIWLEGVCYFCSGPEEQKTRNLSVEPRCVLTTGTDRMKSGVDVVVEGRAERVLDQALLERLAALWQAQLDWPFEVVDGGFHEKVSDASAEGVVDHRVAHVFGIAPDKVLAFGKGEPYSQTRFRFVPVEQQVD